MHSPPPSPVSLGPFDLVRPIGRGGMAEVWLAMHQGTGTEVAIKVVGGEATRQHRWLSRFRNEIRAVAGLSHPGIVHVDDFGEISREAEQRSAGRLQAGSPYLVMELVEGGSLKPLVGRMHWPRLRNVLLHLLDALAHAHARGLIHRDITPGVSDQRSPGDSRRLRRHRSPGGRVARGHRCAARPLPARRRLHLGIHPAPGPPAAQPFASAASPIAAL